MSDRWDEPWKKDRIEQMEDRMARGATGSCARFVMITTAFVPGHLGRWTNEHEADHM